MARIGPRVKSPHRLTSREQEVLKLVGLGLTNEEIAGRLGISANGVKYHVSEILSKLGVSSREEAAAWRPEERAWWRALAPLTLAKAAGVAFALAAVAGLGLLAWGLLEDGGSESAAPGITPTSEPSAPAVFPDAFLEFVERIDRAMIDVDADFFANNTVYGRWDCGDLPLPAGGPACARVDAGSGVEGVSIGAMGSEGTVYDPASYEQFIADWLTEIDFSAFDEYGKPLPRVEAVADLLPEIEGQDEGEDVYSVIATRIAAEQSEAGPAGRQALIFFAQEREEGWQITRLTRAHPPYIDPGGDWPGYPDVSDTIIRWRRWLEVAPATTPSPVLPPDIAWEGNPRAHRLVAYLDSQMRLWLSRADGSSERMIAERPCEEGTEVLNRSLSWSPDGGMIGVVCTNQRGVPMPADQVWRLVVFDIEGDVVATAENVNRYEWSPDSTSIAYQTAEILQEPRLPRVGVIEVGSGEGRIVHESTLLLAWPREGQLLLALDPVGSEGNIFIFPEYQAVWYDVETGAMERVPRLDDNVQFWAGPNGERAIVLAGGADREAGGALMAVYDFATGEETPLDAAIAYPADGIPRWMLAFSSDGNRIYWGDVDNEGPGASIKTTPLDGGPAATVGRVPSIPIEVAGDGLVLYSPPGDDSGALVVHDAQTGAETQMSNRRLGAISPP